MTSWEAAASVFSCDSCRSLLIAPEPAASSSAADSASDACVSWSASPAAGAAVAPADPAAGTGVPSAVVPAATLAGSVAAGGAGCSGALSTVEFVSVVGLSGTVLGLWQGPDARGFVQLLWAA